MFDPHESMAEMNAPKECHRRESQKQSTRKRDRKLKHHYTADSYRHAITRACEKAIKKT